MARPTSQKTIVSRLFSASERPIYILDAVGRIVFHNKALVDWLQVSEEQAQGFKCVYATGQGGNELPHRLAVPPQARQRSEYRATIVVGNGANDSTRSALYVSLDDRIDASSTLVIVDDTEAPPVKESLFDAESLHRELLSMRMEWSQAYSLDLLVGKSSAMRQVRAQVELASETRCRVILVGNDGSGRETIARAIHHERTQGLKSLVPLSCDLLDVELLQTTIESFIRQSSELESETLGTLLLLEVDRLSLEAQSALLGFLEIPELELQTIATCREPLLDLVNRHTFRPDLAQQLMSLEIRLPSLTERLSDVPLLAQWMLERSSERNRVGGFTAEAIEALLRYGWPREVIEMKEIVEQSAARARGAVITREDLPKKLEYAADAAALPDVDHEQVSLDEFLAEVESEMIVRALRQAKGNRAKAARLLGVSRGKLLRRIDQLKVDINE